jgi:hypothetical protein
MKKYACSNSSLVIFGLLVAVTNPAIADGPVQNPSAPGPAFGPELLTTGDMETPVAWEGRASGNSPVPAQRISTADKHRGKSSLFVHSKRATEGYPTLRSPRFATEAGKTYRISYWMKVVAGGLASRRRNGADDEDRILNGAFIYAREWRQYATDYTEVKGGKGAYIEFYPLLNGAEYYLDDVSVREVTTTPASVRAAWLAKFPGREFVCWQKNSPWSNLQALTYPEPGVKECRTVAAALGRNEYESVSFVVTNLTDKEMKLDVTKTAGKVRTTLRSGMFVTAKNGSTINEALALLDGPLVIPPAESREVWLTLQSKDTPAGTYKEPVSLTPVGGTKQTIDLSMKVYPVTLPEEKPLYTCYWDNMVPSWTSREQAIAQMKDLKEHYTNVAVGHPWIVPHFAVDSTGKVIEEYTELDAALEIYQELNPKIILFNWNREAYLKGDPHESVKKYGKQPEYMSAEWKANFRVWLRNWVKHMKAKGYGYDRYAMYPDDESLSPGAAEMAHLIKETDPNVLFYANHMGTNVDEAQTIAPYVDIYSPYLQDYENIPPYEPAPHKDAANRLMKKKPQYFWTYSNPTSLEPQESSGYEDYRLAVWRAWREGFKGFGYYIYSYKTAWNSYDLTEWPTWSVVYFTKPGLSDKELVVPGKRWEATREGVEDYTYFDMLQKAVNKPRKGADPAAVREGRKLLAELPNRVIANPNDEMMADRGKEAILRVLSKIGASP